MADDLRTRIAGMSQTDLDTYKTQLRLRMKTMSPSMRSSVLKNISGIPQLADLDSPQLTMTQLKQGNKSYSTPQEKRQLTSAEDFAHPLSINKEAPWWQQAIDIVSLPMTAIQEYVFNPMLAATVYQPAIQRRLKEMSPADQVLYKQQGIASYFPSGEAYEAYKETEHKGKWAVEALPWFAIPAIGQVGAGKTAMTAAKAAGQALKPAKGIAGVVGQLGKAGKVAGTALEYSPWGLTEKVTNATIGQVGKMVKGGVKKILPEVVEKYKLPAKMADDIADWHNKNKGSTFNIKKGNLSGTDEWSVSVFPKRSKEIVGKIITSRDVDDFARANQDLLLKDERLSIGSWYTNKDNANKTVLDIVLTVPSKREAMDLAERYGQDAIYGLKSGKELSKVIATKNKLIHFGRQGQNHKILDPKYQGLGQVGEEKAMLRDYPYLYEQGKLKKGVNWYGEGQTPEPRFTGGQKYETEEFLRVFDPDKATPDEMTRFNDEVKRITKELQETEGEFFGRKQDQLSQIQYAAAEELGYEAFKTTGNKGKVVTFYPTEMANPKKSPMTIVDQFEGMQEYPYEVKMPEIPDHNTLLQSVRDYISKSKLLQKPVIKQVAGMVNPAAVNDDYGTVLRAVNGKMLDVSDAGTRVAIAKPALLYKEAQKLFQLDDTGKVLATNITPKELTTKSMILHDIIENVDKYKFTDDIIGKQQKDAIMAIRASAKDASEMLKKAGILVNKKTQPWQVVAHAGEGEYEFLHRVLLTVKDESADRLLKETTDVLSSLGHTVTRQSGETAYQYLTRLVSEIKKLPDDVLQSNPQLNKLIDSISTIADVDIKKQMLTARRKWDTTLQGLLAGEKYDTNPINELQKQISLSYGLVRNKRLGDLIPELINTTTAKETAEEILGVSAEKIYTAREINDKMVNYVNRMIRGERPSPAEMGFIRKHFAGYADSIRDSISLSPYKLAKLEATNDRNLVRALAIDQNVMSSILRQGSDKLDNMLSITQKQLDEALSAIDVNRIDKYWLDKPDLKKAEKISNIARSALGFGRETSTGKVFSPKEVKKLLEGLETPSEGIFFSEDEKINIVTNIFKKVYSSEAKTQKDTLSRLIRTDRSVLNEIVKETSGNAKKVTADIKKLTKDQRDFINDMIKGRKEGLEEILVDIKTTGEKHKLAVKEFNAIKNKYAQRMGSTGTVEYGRVAGIPSLGNRVITSQGGKTGQQIADELRHGFGYLPPSTTDKAVKAVGELGAVMRMGRLGYDISFTMIQGLMAMGYDLSNLILNVPRLALGKETVKIGAWSKGLMGQLKTVKNLEYLQKYLASEENQVLAKEFIERGGLIETAEIVEGADPIRRLVEKMGTGKAKTITEKLERNIVERSEEVFTSGRVVTAMEMFKAGYKKAAAEGSLNEWAKTVNLMTGVLSTRGMGISAGQRSLESALAFMSPRFTRANADIIKHILTNPQSYTAKEASKALLAIITASTGLYVGVNAAQGKKVTLNPFDSNFGKIEVGNQKVYLGGIMSDARRLLAAIDSATYSLSHGEDTLSGLGDNTPKLIDVMNPSESLLFQQFRSKTSPVTGSMIDLVTGKDFMGNQVSLPNLAGQWAAPSWTQPLTTTGNVPEAAIQLTGLSSSELTAAQKRNELQDKVASEEEGMNWNTLGLIKGKLAQQRLIEKYSELQEALVNADNASMKNPSANTKLWNEYEHYKTLINDQYKSAIDKAAAEYKVTGNGALFREKVSLAKSNRRSSNAMLEMNAEFTPIMEYFSQTPDPKNTNPMDIARNSFYKAMYSPEMYDIYGNYKFDLAQQKEDTFIAQYGQETMDYINEFSEFKETDLPDEYFQLKNAQEVLKPYWEIENQVWAGMEQLQQLSKLIEDMAVSNPVKAKAMLRTSPYAPMILKKRKEVLLMKKRMKMQNKQIAEALQIFY